MGTNYYFIKENEKIHIGKRHAMGDFCLECMARVYPFDECPICGKDVFDTESTTSFTWAITTEQFMKYRKSGYSIVTEKGREVKDFGGDVLGGCLIQNWEFLGVDFS